MTDHPRRLPISCHLHSNRFAFDPRNKNPKMSISLYVITDASWTVAFYLPEIIWQIDNYSLRSITNPMCRDQGHELQCRPEVSSHGDFELSLLLVLLPGPPPHSFMVLRTFYLNDPLGNNLKMKYQHFWIPWLCQPETMPTNSTITRATGRN